MVTVRGLRGLKIKKANLTTQIFIAMMLGLLVGILINWISVHHKESALAAWNQYYLVDGILKILGKMFINAIKMVVVPLVLISLICGVMGIGDINKLGRVGGKTIFYYIFSTSIAVGVALIVGHLINPGLGLSLKPETTGFTVGEAPPMTQILIDLFPENPFVAMANANMIQVIVIALMTGVAITALGEKTHKLQALLREANDVVMKMIGMVISLAPYGVFGLIAKVFSEQGMSVFMPLMKYMIAIIIALLVHYVFVFLLSLKVMTGLSPWRFIKKFESSMLVAFSTASSKATIPVMLECMEHRMGVSKNIAAFTIPVGASMNMNGTAIMQGIAVLFISQLYGIPLSGSDYLVVIMMSTMAAVGAAGVPGVGLITLSMVLTQVHLPVEGIGIILGVDRIIDMFRTVINVSGDGIVTLIVANSENELNRKIYNDPTL